MDSLGQRAIQAWEEAENQAQAEARARREREAKEVRDKAESHLLSVLGDYLEGERHWTVNEVWSDTERLVARTRVNDSVLIEYRAWADDWSDHWTEALYVIDHCLHGKCEAEVTKFQKVTDLVTLGGAICQNNAFQHSYVVGGSPTGLICDGVKTYVRRDTPNVVPSEAEANLLLALRELTAPAEG